MFSPFKNPWMLAAVVAVAIPLIIEWLFRRRKRQVELPTLRFLLNNKEQEKIRRQDRLLLILRSVAIFLLVMALSRPLIQRGWIGQNRHRNVLVLIDTTASMQQQADNTETSFHKSKRKAAAMIRGLPKDSSTTVTVASFGTELNEIYGPTSDMEQAAGAVEGVTPTFGSAPLADGLKWLKKQLADQRLSQAEVYVFSDFQKQTWNAGDLSVAAALGDLKENCEMFFVDMGGQPTFNYVLSKLERLTQVVTVGMTAKFKVTVTATGVVPKDKRAKVAFTVDGSCVRKEVDLTGGGRAEVIFEHEFKRDGEFLVEAEVFGDDYDADNKRLYLCKVPEAYRVLVLDERGESPTADSFFLARALDPPPRPFDDHKVSNFSVKVAHPDELVLQDLDSYSIIVLAATGSVNDAMARTLEGRVRDGGALLIYCGSAMGLSKYNEYMYNVNPDRSLLPAELVSGAAQPPASALSQPDGGKDAVPMFTGPLWRWQEKLKGAGQMSNPDAGVIQCTPLSQPDGGTLENTGGKVILALDNKVPLMIEKSLGRGKVILCTTTAGVEWTYLPAVQEYGMMLKELLTYLLGDPDREVNLNVKEYFVQPARTTQQITFRLPDGHNVTREPHPVRGGSAGATMGPESASQPDVAAAATTQPGQPGKPGQPGEAGAAGVRYQVVFDDTRVPGRYEVVENQRNAVPRWQFVVNQDSTEADLSRYYREDFWKTFPSATGQWVEGDESIEEMAATLHSAFEMAPAFLCGLIALLVAESFLAWRFGRRRGELPA